MKRIAVFMGTRPEGIKMAPVVAALNAAPDFEPIVVSTGQHKEMLGQVVDLFEIDVHHDLEVMQPNQTLASLSSRLITRIDALLEEQAPDMTLVQGDTTTVLCGALTSFYRRIPIGHVEAGLRTGNVWSPFPEEANRKLVSPIVTLHFAPTQFGRDNLRAEGVADDSIVVTGNTVIDALRIEAERQERGDVAAEVDSRLDGLLGSGWKTRPYVLITGHRRENFGGGFEEICRAIGELAGRFPDHDFVYPVHLNPNVKGPVHERLGARENIKLIPPQDYRAFVALMKHSTIVLTDSGGVQEEAPGLGKPVLVMRDTTERPEGVEAGTVKLVGADGDRIIKEVSILLDDANAHRAMADAVNPYGDGRASERIVERIRKHFA